MSKLSKVILFILFFTIICVGITFSCILYKLNNKEELENSTLNEVSNSIVEENNIPKIEKIVDTVKGIESFADTYKENDLEIKNIPIEMNYTYVQISGLKNKTIENEINEEIKEKAYSLFEEYKKVKNKYENAFFGCSVTANFSDTLSVEISYGYDEETTDGRAGRREDGLCLNYRLDTGEKIEFKDLFIDSANIKSILSQSVYKNLVERYAEFELDSPVESGYISKEKSAILEDEVFRIMAEFKTLGVSKYNFTAKRIYGTIGDTNFAISMPDFYQSIAIYNRFKTNTSLYELSTQDRELFVFMGDHYGTESILKDYADNVFVDIFWYAPDGEEADKYNAQVEQIILEFKEELAGFVKTDEENSNKGYFYCGYFFINDENGNWNVISYISKYEMTREYYDTELKARISEIYAYGIENGGITAVDEQHSIKNGEDISFSNNKNIKKISATSNGMSEFEEIDELDFLSKYKPNDW